MNINIGVWIIVIIAVLIVIFLITTYNNLIRRSEMIENAMAQIATQLQSRWDALNNLIDATKDYARFESETLDKITKNRTDVNRNSSAAEVEKEESEFRSALNQFYAVAENYPDLKSSSVYQTTMDSMNKYEDNVRHSRMVFNDTVTAYNRYLKSFPQNIVAGIFGHHQREYFKNDEQANEVPRFNG